MRILVADDDPSIRRLLTSMLSDMGYEVVAVSDGNQAWDVMRQEDAPFVALLDWMMPGMDGTDVIRNVRSTPRSCSPYLLLLTARDRQGDIVEGLRAGASDYVIKPFDYDELQARLQVGAQMVSFQCDLAQRVRELQEALDHVRRLQGLLPICAYCKKIRDDQNYWHSVENYVMANADVHFSHGVCPNCYAKVVANELPEVRRRRDPL